MPAEPTGVDGGCVEWKVWLEERAEFGWLLRGGGSADLARQVGSRAGEEGEQRGRTRQAGENPIRARRVGERAARIPGRERIEASSAHRLSRLRVIEVSKVFQVLRASGLVLALDECGQTSTFALSLPDVGFRKGSRFVEFSLHERIVHVSRSGFIPGDSERRVSRWRASLLSGFFTRF